MMFDGIDLSGKNLTQIVDEQLAMGTWRGVDDSSPADWLVRAWQQLSPDGRELMATAVNQALQNDSPDVRVEALRTLDMCPQMADADGLLNLAETRFELFRGLRSRSDGPQVDRGRDFIQLTAHVVTGERGRSFRCRLALDPVYGLNVLASLVNEDPDWVLDHVDELFNAQLDPDGIRLNILFFNWRQNLPRLAQLVQHLAQSQPQLHGRIQNTIRTQVRDAQGQRQLLDLVK